jgi:transcriptional regulator with XRE-family HTH domain
MNKVVLGQKMAIERRRAGLTQAELSRRMGTSQPAVSRAESGRCLPTLAFLERFAVATDSSVPEIVGEDPAITPSERRDRIRKVLGDVQFNPWERSPSPAEARSLIRDGLTRERFQSKATTRARP